MHFCCKLAILLWDRHSGLEVEPNPLNYKEEGNKPQIQIEFLNDKCSWNHSRWRKSDRSIKERQCWLKTAKYLPEVQCKCLFFNITSHIRSKICEYFHFCVANTWWLCIGQIALMSSQMENVLRIYSSVPRPPLLSFTGGTSWFREAYMGNFLVFNLGHMNIKLLIFKIKYFIFYYWKKNLKRSKFCSTKS